jgi:hypothetical protein
VSAGTFEVYVMHDNCICELLPDALTLTEESGIMALIAPRAIKMCNHFKDDLPAFNPREMLRSYKNVKPVFEMFNAEKNISYETFDLTHGYWPEDRQAMLGWFNLHLKNMGNGSHVRDSLTESLPIEKLMVYPKGKRDYEVISTEEYCKQKGNELRATFLKTKVFNTEKKRNELKNILRINEGSGLKKVHEYSSVNGWNRFSLETPDDKLIPMLLHEPTKHSAEFIIVANPGGKENISKDLIDDYINSGSGIVLVDLSGTGEASSTALHSNDSVGKLRTLSKSYLLLGKTVLGEWVKELKIIATFVRSRYKSKVSIYGYKEAGLAGLYLGALGENIERVSLQDAPVSYLFDDRKLIEFFSTGIHLPEFLGWGDVSLAAALTGKNIGFINPVTMSGKKISGDKLDVVKNEFEQIRKKVGRGGETTFR